MRTYDEVMAGSLDRPAFSNGTEGHAWMDNWCDRCVHDKPLRDGGPTDPTTGILGCPIIAVAYQSRTPAEWLEQEPFALGDQFHCIEFRDEDDPGPPAEPQPIPDPPGQEALLPREACEGVRMLVPAGELAVAR
jgi:hypothetical protein